MVRPATRTEVIVDTRTLWERPILSSLCSTSPMMQTTSMASSRTYCSASSRDDLSSLCSAAWLKEHLNQCKVLDATWYLPHMGRDPIEEFSTIGRIPGAQFFDLDGVARQDTDLPHMLPTEQGFAAAASALGISPNDTVVVYDRQGIFSAPRAWWTWKVFGHKHVYVLDGGLPAWQEDVQGEVDMTPVSNRDDVEQATRACQDAMQRGTSWNASTDASYPSCSLNTRLVASIDDVLERAVYGTDSIVVDARPAARFYGEAEEPRKGLAKGHMPNGKNIPWNAVLTESPNARFKSPDEIQQVFQSVGIDPKTADFSNVIASCGSGTTACILVLAAQQMEIGSIKPMMPVYDGSWSEYGALPNVPVS